MHIVDWTCVVYEQFEFGGSDVIVLFFIELTKNRTVGSGIVHSS